MITGQSYADLFRATFGVQRQKWEEPKLLDENMIINSGNVNGIPDKCPLKSGEVVTIVKLK